MNAEALARQLFDAATTATPVELLTDRYPDIDWGVARSIARETDRLRRADGQTQIGWKLGWTSEAMRAALGIDRPNWGTLWQSQCAGETVELRRFIHPKLEPEFVWRAGSDLDGPNITASDVHDAGGEWALGIEVVDPRFPSFEFDALDNTADNSSSAAICVGTFIDVDSPSALDHREVHFSDGSQTRTGLGSQAMGSPAEAVAWLVRSLTEEGLAVRRGDLVFTGGITAPFDAVSDRTYEVASQDMVGVNIRFI